MSQYQHVRKLLKDDPRNTEYADVEKELVEVIALTKELLETAQDGAGSSGVGIGTRSADASPTFHHSDNAAASSGMADGHKIPVGTKVQAVYSEDGEWYDATIEAYTPNGYLVAYNGWGNKEEVDPDNVRVLQEGIVDPLLEAEKEAEATKQALKRKIAQAATTDVDFQSKSLPAKLRIEPEDPEDVVDPDNVRVLQEGIVDPLLEAEKEAEATKQALKRKIAQAATTDVDFQSKSLPAKLRIEPEDPEDVKAAKRKKIHAFKSKMRKEQIEVTQNKRQNAWQEFQTTKGRAKKIGFFSGRKRESIFKSPDDPFGKVGVTRSGKGLTDFQRREKHLHLKGANAENTED
ncbi:Survival motor neuron [Artemisia annua]|uniref:Survival motor neuron n=1 Tax=Artemisia annua TaxID=35608 RepID=A0A2U1M864_ARTAN|nr:Survival motor neuron [Artemisia annua]